MRSYSAEDSSTKSAKSMKKKVALCVIMDSTLAKTLLMYSGTTRLPIAGTARLTWMHLKKHLTIVSDVAKRLKLVRKSV